MRADQGQEVVHGHGADVRDRALPDAVADRARLVDTRCDTRRGLILRRIEAAGDQLVAGIARTEENVGRPGRQRLATAEERAQVEALRTRLTGPAGHHHFVYALSRRASMRSRTKGARYEGS